VRTGSTDEVVRAAGTGENPVFSPDSRWAAIRNPKQVTLLDGQTGEVVGQPIPAGGKLVQFSPDGDRLATAELQGGAQVWDVPTGNAVTEPLRHPPFASNRPEFSADARFLKSESPGQVLVWSVPPPLPEGMPPPEWLLELATLCASQLVNENGQLVPATGSAANAERLRRQIGALPADAPLAEWGRWVLDDRADRPIAPGFTLTPAEAEAAAAGRSRQ
jgi:WD40 repeat protein